MNKILTLAALATAVATIAPAQQPITIKLDLSPRGVDMDFLKKNQMGYMPSGVTLITEKPKAITKTPDFKGKVQYGAVRFGNGPQSVTFFAVDETKEAPGQIYFDFNQNGDLTDEGSGKWDEAKEYDGVMSYTSIATFHASWGTPIAEEEGGSYSLMIYKRHGDTRVGFTKVTARTGKFTLANKTYTVMLTENGSDGIFTVAKSGDRTRRPVQLMIDLDGDGLYKGAELTIDGKKMRSTESFMIDQPFQVNGQWWDAMPSISGSELTLVPTVEPGKPKPQAAPVEDKPLLKVGTTAPNFTAQTPDGKPIQLSSFKGKVVLLDFWATWCGPCMQSMPGLQKIYDGVKGQGVVVFSVNVFDAKDPFDAWIKKTAYNFTFAFDPAGRDQKTSIAASKYNVSGIPTMYVIDRTGKISAVLVGSGEEKAIEKALTDLKIKVKE
ncbi:MAG: TlpA family protein disulfide reductase [Armatimonadetes bacterium]|nr:TlpA family protein disulfide reductase [Armatimonadota bacterium]